jgi:O-succinylbenzoic acid--CoA ligase
MAIIHYKNKSFNVNECLKRSGEIHCNYFKNVASLIDAWNNGQKTFELKTSGSTGKPKPIVFTREQCIKSAEQTIAAFGLKKGGNFLCCLDISFVAGFMMIIRALVAGANIYLTKAERNPFLKTAANVKFDFAAFVPYQLQCIIEETPENIVRLNGMKAIIIGGGAISIRNMELFQQIQSPVFHTYGMTETLTHVALKRINSKNPESSFKALPGVSFSKDSRDCLVIKTPILKEEIETNDIVNLISDTEFEYLGRIDHVINSGGYKIHPQLVEQKIEAVINDIFQTANYFIFAADDVKFGQHAELMIEAETEQSKINRLKEELKILLNPYEVPKAIHFCRKFVLTRTGKVDRRRTHGSKS